MSEWFGPVEGGGHLQVSPEIIPIASRQLPHLYLCTCGPPCKSTRYSRRYSAHLIGRGTYI